jgi:hypothetical protein
VAAASARAGAAPRSADAGPERWALDAGDAAEAVLVIPPDARRERRFDIACAATVRCGDSLAGAWHEMTVLANGAQQWRRRIASSNPGSEDGLDLHFRRDVPVGEALRLVVRVAVRGVRRHRLRIEADEA